MKLYTEEQVRKAMSALNDIKYMYHSDDDIFEELTPIKLPSDEELEEWIINRNYEFSRVDIQTTKWVIEQIKQQNETRR